ncbi:hypothetical protein QJQ45_026852 [Haematococcus lacustris]|nr:hypothetical protein QJQ45_026852 [Haematococcus lacustris]
MCCRQDFLSQVKTKLKLSAWGSMDMYLASSGQKVTSLDELQDIDELMVVEGQAPAAVPVQSFAVEASRAQTPYMAEPAMEVANGQVQFLASDRHKMVVGPDTATPPSSARAVPDGDEDSKAKYSRRAHPLRRLLQRLLPAAFAPSLPVSTRDLAPGTPGTAPADTDKGTAITRLGRRKKGKRSSLTLGAALMAVAVVFCLVTMIWFMLRGAPGIARQATELNERLGPPHDATQCAPRGIATPCNAGPSGSGQQEDEGQGQGEQEVIAERRQVIKAAFRALVEAARPDLNPAQVDAVVAQVNQRMTMGSMQCCLASVMDLTMLLQSFLGQPSPGFPAAGPAPCPPPPPDPACPPYSHPRLPTRRSPRSAAPPAQLPPPVQLDIEDPNLLPQSKAAMDLLTNASVQEHMMRGPHHRGIRLLPGEVAVFKQPSSAWPVAKLQQLEQVVNGMKWVSRQHYGEERGVAVFLGAGNFSQGGWKAGAVRAGFCKVVEQPSRPSTDPRPDRLVIVDEFRTSRVSSSVHARQPSHWGEQAAPLELCHWKDLEALPPIGKEYRQGYKLVSDRLPKDRQRLHRAAEYRRGIEGRARNNA